MTRNYSVLGSCIAVSLLLSSAQAFAAGDIPQRPGPGRAAPQAPSAAADALGKLSSAFDIRGTQHAVFNFNVAAPGKISINIQSQGDQAVRFLVKPSGEALFINTAPFEYLATAEDVSRGPQWKVDVYLPAGRSAQGAPIFNPNAHASGNIAMFFPAAAGAAPQPAAGAAPNPAVPSAAAHMTDQPLTMAPVAFAQPMLARRRGELTPVPVNISGRFEHTQQIPVHRKPFTLDEVFDPSGKPIFAVDENTGALPLPHGARIHVYRGAQADTGELQRRGVAGFRVAQGGSFHLKTEAGKQVVTVPRGDGSSVTVPAEVFLRELNSYEQGLNALGISLRDGASGKINATPQTVTAARLHVDTMRIRQQHIEHDGRIVKGVTPRSWNSDEVFMRHQKAVERLPAILRGANNRMTSATVPASAPLLRLPGNRAGQMAARANQPLRAAPAAAAMQKCALAPSGTPQPDGGAIGEVVALSVAKYDASACVVSITDAQNRQVDIQQVNQSGPGQLSVTVPPGLAKGAGSIALRARTTPYVDAVPFYVGPVCSVDSAYPATGMAGTELLLTVGRFNGCDLDFADALGGKTPVTYSVVDAATIKAKVPNFSIGNDKIEAARHPGRPGEQTQVSSWIAFTLQRTVVDQNGNAPPPDYFAQGIQPFERKYGWSQQYGDPASFAVDVFATLSIYSDGKTKPSNVKRPEGGDQGDNQVIFLGDGGARGWLFNNQADIIVAHAIASVPTATSKDSKLRVNFNVDAGGVTIYRWKKNKDKEDGTSDAQNVCEDNQKVNGKCCDDIKPNGSCADDGFAVQAQIKYEHEYTLLNVDQSVSTSFPLGPVPMVARFGFQGEAGAHVRFALSPLQAIGQVTPHARVSIYGECGVTILFATAGVGADMVLADVKLDAAGSVYLDFGQMALVTQLYVNYDYDLLDGSVYVFIDGFGHRVKQTMFDINELASQASGQNLVFKGSNYLLAPQTYTLPLLSGS